MADQIDLLHSGPINRMKLLNIVAVELIRGNELPEDIRKWLGYGLLALASGKDRNDSFEVEKTNEGDIHIHAVRWGLVERLREKKD